MGGTEREDRIGEGAAGGPPLILPPPPPPPTGDARPVFICAHALRGLAGRLALRDPAGRSAHPHLRRVARGGHGGFLADGPFNIITRYRVSRAEGAAFCRATGDANEIHLTGDVVPGALTAARAVTPLEVLFPDLEVTSFTVKFTAIGTYGRAQCTLFRCTPEPGGLRFHVRTLEGGREIAELEVRATPVPPAAPAAVARRSVSVERLRTVREFLRAIGIAPHVYFGHAAVLGYFYPRSFLAALPSGAMVRELRGQGGLLNKLTLEFDPGARVPIAAREGPSVGIEQPRSRRTFNKILTTIGDSIRTYVRGTALVLSRDSMPTLPPPATAGDKPATA
jgi:hypothetical protein